MHVSYLMDAAGLSRLFQNISLIILFVLLLACGQDPKNPREFTDTESVKALEYALSDVEFSLEQKKERMRELDARIQGQEFLISTLKSTAVNPYSLDTRLDEFQEFQENISLQVQRDRLYDQISKQEQVVASQQQLLALSVAPEGSELVVKRRFELEQAQRDLRALKDQVSDLYILQQEMAAQKFMEKAQRQVATQAAQTELGAEVQSAQADLETRRQDQEKLRTEISEDERKSEQLGQEREVKIQLRRELENPR